RWAVISILQFVFGDLASSHHGVNLAPNSFKGLQAVPGAFPAALGQGVAPIPDVVLFDLVEGGLETFVLQEALPPLGSLLVLPPLEAVHTLRSPPGRLRLSLTSASIAAF